MSSWRTLPRNAAYKYEYANGNAILSARPVGCRVVLRLRASRPKPVEGITLRRLQPKDWKDLAESMAWAFHRVQPFESLDDAKGLEAARDCLNFTRKGGDGPLVPDACFVASMATGPKTAIVGAIVITLRKAKSIKRQKILPHLTWIFVEPPEARRGIGAALLAASTEALRTKGYKSLESTILVGNSASMMWHWRMGFRLLTDDIAALRRQFRIPRAARPVISKVSPRMG
jgi:GNAT superfamily N-acetyltransferase